ncbi:hypothetical protein DMB66_01660 [Actinoplanes sp. ATCC 53533]|uniref:hypothetical protein n=1 Tax=Actinoplanes sp. ATCC 53533 TaxID=1288362 RepID=UPI000F7A9587|nr:hypothetical protein [Actinoplanes sp. ATCC 53533]RSM74150.1 hypothetical protein DMB66_01660 [Actinoplanes sp. ATCC 53533]
MSLLAMMILGIAALIGVGTRQGWWYGGLAALAVGIGTTGVPIIWSFLGFVPLNDPGPWFEQARNLGTHAPRLEAHYKRIKGTLRYWKNKAAAHQRLHQARVMWSLISGVSLPLLVQRFDKNAPGAILFMTVFTTWTGLISVLAYTLKSEEKYQGFRQQESDFYDEGRRLLDFADPADPKFAESVDAYIRIIDQIRRVGRRVETGSPPSAV